MMAPMSSINIETHFLIKRGEEVDGWMKGHE
jgi:hypothetical protein